VRRGLVVFCCSIEPCGQQVVARHSVNLRCELHTTGLGSRCRNNVQRNPNSTLDVTVLSHSSLSRTAFTHGARTTLPRNPISFSVILQIQILYATQAGNNPIQSYNPTSHHTSSTRNFLSLASCQCKAYLLSLATASANAEMLDPGDKVVIVLVKRAFTLFSSKLSEDHHMPCGITSL